MSHNVFTHLDNGLDMARHGFAGIPYCCGYTITTMPLASKLWLKIHVERTRHRLDVAPHAEGDMKDRLPSGKFDCFPINIAL
jgi:hypothetical protein